MPYNGAGVFTLPIQFVPNSPATAADQNTQDGDIATALNNVLCRDGQSVMTGQIKADTGSASAPGYTFGGDLDTGFYRAGANMIGIATNGISRGTIDTDSIDLSLDFNLTGDLTVTGALAFTGNLDITGDLDVSGTITGPGSGITALNASNLASGTVPNARFPATLPAVSGANLTSLNASTLASGTVPSARVSGGYGNITALGTLTGLTVSGAVTIGTDLSIGDDISIGGTIVGLANEWNSANSSTLALNIRPHSSSSNLFSISQNESTAQMTATLAAASTASRFLISCNNPNGQVGSVQTFGLVTNFNTSSDGRRKTNLRDFDAGAIIDALDVYEYDWLADGSTGHGVIAQQAIEVFPEAITHDPETDYWGRDDGKFVPLLLRDAQTGHARFAAIESRLSAAGL